MIVVGMISAYKEGRLVQGAIRSLEAVGLDHLYIFEGPAGEPLPDDVPESDYGEYGDPSKGSWVGTSESGLHRVHRGRWRTDGRKRNEMLQRAKDDQRTGGPTPQPFWCVVLDADEILVNAEYLRDRLEWVEAEDAFRKADINDVENPPMARWPLRLVDPDGSISTITGRVFRGNLVRSIDISSSVVTNLHGIQEGWGNFEEAAALWVEQWGRAIDDGKLIAFPPLSCEPHILHRSNLRHPLRRGLRMSAQEAVEFAAAQEKEQWPAKGSDENDYSPETP